MATHRQPEKRVRLTMKEKVQIHDFREKNPKMSYDAIEKFFSKKFGKGILRNNVKISRKRGIF